MGYSECIDVRPYDMCSDCEHCILPEDSPYIEFICELDGEEVPLEMPACERLKKKSLV